MKIKVKHVLLFILVAAVSLEVLLRLAGYGFLLLQRAANLQAMSKGNVRILCLGESTTALGGRDSYPAQLEQVLKKSLPGLHVSVINAGRPGINTTFILSELAANLEEYSPQVVVAMMGANDANGEYSGSYDNRGSLSWVSSLRIFKLYRLIRSSFDVGSLPRNRGFYFDQIEELCIPFFVREQAGTLRRYFGKEEAAYRQYIEFRTALSALLPGHQFEESLRSAILQLPRNPWSYAGLGRCLWYRGQELKAGEAFAQALDLAPGNGFIAISIAACYLDRGQVRRAEDLLKRSLAIQPSAFGYAGLAACAFRNGRVEDAEKLFGSSFETGPENWLTYAWAGNCYMDRREYKKAEKMLERSIALEPGSAQAYFDLAQNYWLEKDYVKARAVIESALLKCSNNDRILSMAGNFFRRQRQHDLADEFSRKSQALRLSRYIPATRDNYRKLKEELDAQHIQLVCVQYPRRKAEELKKMFDDPQGIIFVDNSGVFEQALNRMKFNALFTDSFGGDFGHCTPLGNRILAENIARVLAKDYFKQ